MAEETAEKNMKMLQKNEMMSWRHSTPPPYFSHLLSKWCTDESDAGKSRMQFTVSNIIQSFTFLSYSHFPITGPLSSADMADCRLPHFSKMVLPPPTLPPAHSFSRSMGSPGQLSKQRN
jgi:hypothetical protein